MSRRVDVGAEYAYDLAAAMAAKANCHTFYIPSEIARYQAASAAGWNPPMPQTTIEGDGRHSGEDAGLWPWADPLVPNRLGTGDSTIIRVTKDALTLRDLVISNNRGYVKGVGDGVAFTERGTISGPDMHGVGILYVGRHCVNLQPQWEDDGRANYIVGASWRDCVFYGAGSHGLVLDTVNVLRMDHVFSIRHGGRGLVLTRGGLFDITSLVCENVNGGVLIQGAGPGTISGHFEQFARGGQPFDVSSFGREPGIILDNVRGVTLGSSTFGDWTGANPVSILLRNGTTGCTIMPSTHAGVSYTVDDGGCSGNTIWRQKWPPWHPPIPWKVSSKRNEVLG
jgi:hypothetical protein